MDWAYVRPQTQLVAFLDISHIGQCTFLPYALLGLAGMPRRIPDYAIQFADVNQVVSIGGFAFGLSQLIFLWLAIKCVRGGEPAPSKPWDRAEGLEWTVPSPAPHHTFTHPPKID